MARLLPKPAEGEEIEPIADLDRLIYTMGQVAAYAPEVGLPQFQYGFHGYQKVTQAVTDQLDKNVFEDPGKMEKTMPLFAERAFAPIRHHVHGDTSAVGAWSSMLYRPEAVNALPSTAMVDFLGFHVIYDLPFTLQESDTDEHHKKDYTEKINIILSSVGRELLPDYIDVHSPFKQLGASDMGLRAVLMYLFKARDDAWKAFEQLQVASSAQSAVTSEQNSTHFLHRRTSVKPPKTIDAIEQELRKKASNRMLSTKKTADFVLRRTARIPVGPWRHEDTV